MCKVDLAYSLQEKRVVIMCTVEEPLIKDTQSKSTFVLVLSVSIIGDSTVLSCSIRVVPKLASAVFNV